MMNRILQDQMRAPIVTFLLLTAAVAFRRSVSLDDCEVKGKRWSFAKERERERDGKRCNE
jgi:hypothetical protein